MTIVQAGDYVVGSGPMVGSVIVAIDLERAERGQEGLRMPSLDEAANQALQVRDDGRGWRPVRSVAFDIVFSVWTALFGLVIPGLWLGQASSATVRRVARLWARGFLALLAGIVGIRYVEQGRLHLPAGPCLIVANHQSVWETVAVLVLFPDLAIVAKQELRRVPVVGWFLEHSAMIIIDRADGANALRKMTDAARAAVRAGRSVLIFPEGSRTAVDAPLKFKRGLELVYRALDIPVLPVALNSGRFWRQDPKGKWPGTITVAMQPAIAPGLSPRLVYEEVQTILGAAKAAL